MDAKAVTLLRLLERCLKLRQASKCVVEGAAEIGRGCLAQVWQVLELEP